MGSLLCEQLEMLGFKSDDMIYGFVYNTTIILSIDIKINNICKLKYKISIDWVYKKI